MKNTAEKDDFYVGWQPKAPKSYARPSRNFALLAILIVMLAMAGLVLNQRGFADSVFEFGNVKTLEGVLVLKPFPMLKVENDGKTESILLVGLGKYGAEPILDKILAREGVELGPNEGLGVKLKGTLIYDDGKKALELTDEENSMIEVGDKISAYASFAVSLGQKSLKGEILDPKCALGVMKPGYGKPHRSCAIRCIAGGIPAMFRVKYEDGKVLHALLVGTDGKKLNEELLPYVADQVLICGELGKVDDWYVLVTDPNKKIQRLAYYGAESSMSNCGG